MNKLSRFFKKFERGNLNLQAAILTLGLTATTLANPSGPTVRHGQVNIVGGTQAQIQQLTDQAIVDWQSFSIGANESVQFFQPSQLSVILNRVTGGDPSTILGQLRANGNVFLINPNGILFGPNSVVSVGGLVASSLNITDQDFLSGNYSFQAVEGQDLGAVVNQGRIEITDGGYAVLTGSSVINEGTIVARGGNVILAAGEKATLNLDGRDLVHFSLDSEVSNGTVLLAPGMMSDAIAETLGVDRYERADRLVQEADGSVRMLASAGTLVQDGTVSTEGVGYGAGSVLLESTNFTLLTAGSVTSASATGTGDGGEILVLSAMDGGTTVVEAGALLTASAESGDAGFIETSAEVVQMAGRVDGSSVSGKAGSYLLDPTTIRIVDDSFGGMPPIGESYVTDLSLEMLLDTNMSATVMSDMAIISDVTTTSGGTDTGIQSAGTGFLTFDTLTLVGTDVDLQSDQFTLGDSFFISAQGAVDLGSSVINTSGMLNINSLGQVDLGSAQVTADTGVGVIADPGGIVGDGFSMETRSDPTDFSNGGEITLSATGNINLSNATMNFAQDSVGGLTINTDGSILISDSTLTSEFEAIAGFRDDPKAFVIMTTTANSNDITLTNTTVTGTDITLSGNNVNLQTANLLATVRATGGAVPSTPAIRITAENNINGPTGNNSLHAALIELTSNSASIQANIDTSTDGDDAGRVPPYTSIPTLLNVDASNGSIAIQDIAPNNALGIDLRRPIGPGTQALLAGGDITVTSQGKIGFGTGNGTTVGDPGTEMVTTTDPNATVTFSAVGPLLDQNGTTGVVSPLEIVGGSTVSLSSDVGIGSTTIDPFFTGVFEVATSDLIIDSNGAGTEVNVGGPNFNNIDAVIEGGEFKVTDQGDGTTLEIIPNGTGPDVLQTIGTIQSTNVRISTSEDVGVSNVSFAGTTFVLSTSNGGRILNEDPSGTGNPSVVLSGGSQLVLNSSGDTGSETDPFRVQGDTLFIGDTTSKVFLDLTPATAPGITIEGADPRLFTDPLTPPFALNTTPLTIGGDLVILSSAPIELQSSINSGAGIAIDVNGFVDLLNAGSGLTASDGIIIRADQLLDADNRLSGGVIGLEIGQDVGSAANPLEIDDLSSLVVGNDPTRSYFLRDNGPGDATLVDTFTVGGVTVTGNQTDTFQLEKTQGSLAVDTNITGNTRIELQVAGDISQRSAGLINAPEIVLDAGGNIGDINTDQQINGDTLAIASGGSAYVRDTGGDLELVDDPALSQNVGAQNDFRVRVDNGDLTVSTDVSATDIALIGGTDLEISPQTTAQDVILAGNVSATGNLVVIAAGDIIPVSGTLSANGIGLGAGGSIGTAANPVSLNANELTLNQPDAHFQTTNTPVSVDSTSAAGATVNAQASEVAEGTIVVEVVLEPTEEVPSSVFAQDDVDLVEDFLKTLRDPVDILEDILDPTATPLDWYNDDDFLQRKWRS